MDPFHLLNSNSLTIYWLLPVGKEIQGAFHQGATRQLSIYYRLVVHAANNLVVSPSTWFPINEASYYFLSPKTCITFISNYLFLPPCPQHTNYHILPFISLVTINSCSCQHYGSYNFFLTHTKQKPEFQIAPLLLKFTAVSKSQKSLAAAFIKKLRHATWWCCGLMFLMLPFEREHDCSQHHYALFDYKLKWLKLIFWIIVFLTTSILMYLWSRGSFENPGKMCFEEMVIFLGMNFRCVGR